MPPSRFYEVDGKPIDGVYGQLDFTTYKKYSQVPGRPLTSCALCGQESKYVKEDGVDLKMCRGCFSVAFCSKKCQIAHWASHKRECQGGPSAVGQILTETTARFLSDPILLHHLRVALIAKLAICVGPAIFEDPLKCYLVVIYMHFHPISSSHEQDFILGRIDPKGKDEIPGFLRLEIHDDPLEAIRMDTSGKGGLTRQRESDTILVRLWRQARKHANSIGRQRSVIVMAGFGYENVRMDYAIEITPEALATALGNPNISPVTALPPSIKAPPRPWHYDTVMFFIIQEYIKLDKDDTLELRRNLRKSDKERLLRIGVEFRQIHGPRKLLGDGWSITEEGELDLPEESRNFAVVHRK